jgi:hypothetical protein
MGGGSSDILGGIGGGLGGIGVEIAEVDEKV